MIFLKFSVQLISAVFIHVDGVPTVNGYASFAVILAVASIPAAIDPAIDLAALTDVSVVAGVPAAASVTDR